MKRVLIGCGVVAAVVLVLAVAVGMGLIGGYNRLVGLSQGVDQSWAQVQNVYQRRADLVPNLVATVQGAAGFEKSTLVEITRARASVGQLQVDPNSAPVDPARLRQFEQAHAQLGSALSRLMVVVERYPDLRANANFQSLQATLEGTENRITVERQRFNEAVQAYNILVRRFPTLLYAGAMGFVPKPYFSAAPGADTVPKVQFDFSPGGRSGSGTPTPAPAPGGGGATPPASPTAPAPAPGAGAPAPAEAPGLPSPSSDPAPAMP